MALDAPTNAQFPEKFQVLFEDWRYKVFYGGRGGAKSWAIARWLLIDSLNKPTTNLCAREWQNSIKDSVHRLLATQIDAMQMNYLFDIQQASIKGSNGTEFNFEGIRHNIGKIKSYEGVDRCWVEEAQSVSESSWDVLIPTIRKPGSQIIVSFNPDLETDATYQRFILHPPPNSAVIKVSWRDNPWFDETELPAERDALKARNYDSYLHVWEGECKQNLEGSVYADELREATLQGRICKVPYDRAAPVHTWWDLGRSDHTSIWFIQQIAYEYHAIDFYQSNLKHIDHYLGVLQKRDYVLGTLWLPHDAKAKQLGSKMTIEEQCRSKFPSVRIVPKVSIKDKINSARTVFPNCWFDQEKTAEGVHALRHYRYEVDQHTKQFSQHPLHDGYSDAASAFEYFGVTHKMPNAKTRLNLRDPGGPRELIGTMLSPAEWFAGSPPGGNSWLGR